MKKVLFFLLGFLFSFSLFAKEIRIGIVDVNLPSYFKAHFKRKGVRFCDGYEPKWIGSSENTFHGVSVTKLITSNIKKGTKYCIAYFPLSFSSTREYIRVLRKASKANLDYLNLSLDGSTFLLDEYILIKKMLKNGVKIVVAAGNNGKEIKFIKGKVNSKYLNYPASISPDLYVIGAIKYKNVLADYSNYGIPVDWYCNGNDSVMGFPLHGTSQAAPRFLATLVNGEEGKGCYKKIKKESITRKIRNTIKNIF